MLLDFRFLWKVCEWEKWNHKITTFVNLRSMRYIIMQVLVVWNSYRFSWYRCGGIVKTSMGLLDRIARNDVEFRFYSQRIIIRVHRRRRACYVLWLYTHTLILCTERERALIILRRIRGMIIADISHDHYVIGLNAMSTFSSADWKLYIINYIGYCSDNGQTRPIASTWSG